MEGSRKRLSRFGTDPILRDGEPIAIWRPTPLDDRMMEALASHRFLTAPYIAAFAGTSADYVTDRFKVLKRKPNLYVQVADEQRDNPRAYQNWPLYYELADRGKERLEARHVDVETGPYQGSFDHQIMVYQAMASFRLAAKERSDELRFVPWSTIRTSPNLSAEAREAVKHSHSIPVTVRVHGSKDVKVTADDYPFGLELTKNGTYIFFPGVEIEYSRKRRATRDFNAQSLRRKFFTHASIIEGKVYRSYFGFRRYYVPFIFTTVQEMNSAMKHLEGMVRAGEVTENAAQFLLFKNQPAPGSYEKPSPTGHMVSDPWHRVGHPPFQILS
jgi:hypothetical protein